jgi:thiopurine S-methyltransferase
MDHGFWHERWQNNQIGFHGNGVNPHLEKYWPKLAKAADELVFVPLCGKSDDLLWLLQQGYRVIGVELSPIAVHGFFAENGLEATVTQSDGFGIYRIDGLQLWCGDFFALPPASVEGVALIYDRASLVALPPEMRAGYAAKLRSLVEPGTQILLVSFAYDQAQMPGPPFSVERYEIEKLYGEWCGIELLDVQDVLDQQPQFRDKGVSAMDECVYKLTVF